nr:reverse transcriptase domain-containing protein [Tanacetum cinerariifolium]
MAVAAIKHMALNFVKLDKFEGVDFRRWQKKMHYFLSSLSVVYVLITPIPDDGDDATVDQIRKRAKWDNDDYVCRGLILNGMSDSLFDIYQNVKSSKELWDSLGPNIWLRMHQCMRTRRSYFPPTSTIPRRSKKQTTNVVEPDIRTIVEMADNRTMAQMLQAPIEGYEDAIVVPQINANNFELKQTLINLVQSNQFTGRQDPYNHLRFFNKVTSTFRHLEVPNTTIKLLLFPFSLEREARIWPDKEPPRSILTWEDLVSKFINQFFPPSKTTYLRNEITNFLQKPNETFNEAWERFKDLLRQYPHHDFSELHQLDTFYNALNTNDQDALDSAAGGNFLDKIPRECLSIIESKSKVRYSRSRITDSRANTNAHLSSYLPSNSFDLQQIVASLEEKLDIRMTRFEKSLNDMKNSFISPTAPIKTVEEVCVTCGANHSYN